MTKSKKSTKLSLTTESIRTLDAQDLRNVGGGWTFTIPNYTTLNTAGTQTISAGTYTPSSQTSY
jgi:hypothetical protein